jgi:hypothetical protein
LQYVILSTFLLQSMPATIVVIAARGRLLASLLYRTVGYHEEFTLIAVRWGAEVLKSWRQALLDMLKHDY